MNTDAVMHDAEHKMNAETELFHALVVYRETKAQIDAVTDEVKPVMDAARAKIEALLQARGENYEDGEGYVRLREGYERVSYDAAKVDDVAFMLIAKRNEFSGRTADLIVDLPTSEQPALQTLILDMLGSMAAIRDKLAAARKVGQAKPGIAIK